jgi:hypothetical protein
MRRILLGAFSLAAILACGSVVPAATITMGETAITSILDSGNGNLLIAQQATLGQPATIQSLFFYIESSAGFLRLGVYDAGGAGGDPGALVAQTAEFSPVAGWNTQPVVAPTLLAAGTYWLAYLPSSSSLSFRNEQTGDARFLSMPYGPMPGNFPSSPATGNVHFSFYATLEIGAAPIGSPGNLQLAFQPVIVLAWDDPNSGPSQEDDSEWEQALGGMTGWQSWTILPPDVVTHTARGIRLLETWCFRGRYRNTAGMSDWASICGRVRADGLVEEVVP